MGLKPGCWLALLALSACQTNRDFNDVDDDGYVETSKADTANNDCEPDDPAIHPGAEEVWDGRDNDCNNHIDEDFDADGDEVPATPWGLDCDDNDPQVSPRATEVCGDGIDNDCDGVAGGAWPSTIEVDGTGISPWSASDPCARPACLKAEDQGRLGAGLAATMTANEPQLVLIFSAPDADEAQVRLLIAPADTTVAPQELGSDDTGAESEPVELAPLETPEAAIHAPPDTDAPWGLGERLVTGADLDGGVGESAGEPDLVMSAYSHSPSWVLICPGPLDADDRCDGLIALEVGADDAPALGGPLALLHDQLGDGLADLLVGAPNGDEGGDVWLVAGSASLFASGVALDDDTIPSELSAESLDGKSMGVRIRGEGFAGFGSALASVEDVDGTRWSAMMVGAPLAAGCDPGTVAVEDTAGGEDTAEADDTTASTGGAVWLIDRSRLNDAVDGTADDQDNSQGVGDIGIGEVAGPCFEGRSGEGFGTSVVGGDLDGDGYPDLAIGAPTASRGALDEVGAVYLYTNWSWRTAEEEAEGRAVITTATATTRLEGSQRGQQVGSTVAMVGDLDGDGLGDLMIGGAPDVDSGSSVGLAWLVPGQEADQWDPWVDLDAEANVTRFTSADGQTVAVSAVPEGGGLLGGALLSVPDINNNKGTACLLPARGP